MPTVSIHNPENRDKEAQLFEAISINYELQKVLSKYEALKPFVAVFGTRKTKKLRNPPMSLR
jgi:hypothetical protein